MPTTVVVGGQYGGEGKGKITSHIVRTQEVDLVVRCGGPNSGHTVTLDGEQTILRQVPAGVVKPGTKMALAAGCLIDEDILLDEVIRFGIKPDQLVIDKKAVIIKENYKHQEQSNLKDRIASTCTGTGIAVAKRSLRDPDVTHACDSKSLKPFLGDVSKLATQLNRGDGRVVIEGTQGFGLSVYHSPHYPFTTSRDTTASAFLSEVGMSPQCVDSIYLVLRTFPIRVGGRSGPMGEETDWETITRISQSPIPIQEFTSVTRTLRRVAKFDHSLVRQAININQPTNIVLNGLDYIDYRAQTAKNLYELPRACIEFIDFVSHNIQSPIHLIGNGPDDNSIINIAKTSVVEGI